MSETRENGAVALRLDGISRIYEQGEIALKVFEDLNLDIREGEMVALVGHSGAGKSSLLHIAGLLEKPSGGRVEIAGRDCTALGEGTRTAMRRAQIGFVYQFHNLLPEFSAQENVALPAMVAGVTRKEAMARADRLLSKFGLGARLVHRPAELSGGEQQRVAIARALANRPKLVLADEPTGNLDPATSGGVFRELLEVTRTEGAAALIATHNLDLAGQMDRIVLIHEGAIHEGEEIAKRYHSL
ncbi:ABC transporter ATP-binding protein [Tepidicaulis sp. LMO-SS28]|uniref:ABC transporter ATP-binding protein n=1 Tax=Tepidicaulis sp. LMO-SS28 TaxID=3447455 RepID=UPI003EE33BD0